MNTHESEKPQASGSKTRTALQEYLAALISSDLDRLKSAYSEDAVLLTWEGKIRGRDQIAAWVNKHGSYFRLPSFRLERLEARYGTAALDWWATKGGQNASFSGRDEFDLTLDGLISEQRIIHCAKTDSPRPFIRFEIELPLARIIIDRDEKRNAVSQPMLAVMKKAVAEVAADSNIRALVISGEGRDFCAGEDVKGFNFVDVSAASQFLDGPLDLFTALETMPKPVTVAVHGNALGLGSEILLVSDSVYASREAVFGFAEIDHGAVPSVLVTRGLGVVFRRRAMGLALTGRRINAAVALEIGLIHAVVDDPLAAAETAALKMAAWSPDAVRVIKDWMGNTASDDHARAHDFMSSVMMQVEVSI